MMTFGKPRPAPTHLMRGSEQLQSSPNDGSENKVGFFFRDTDRLPDSASQKKSPATMLFVRHYRRCFQTGSHHPHRNSFLFPFAKPIQIAGDGRPNRFIREWHPGVSEDIVTDDVATPRLMSQRSTLAAIAVETDPAGCNAGEHVTRRSTFRADPLTATSS